jgi:hypothetical protein
MFYYVPLCVCAEQTRHSGNFSYSFTNDGDDDGNDGNNGAAMVTRKNIVDVFPGPGQQAKTIANQKDVSIGPRNACQAFENEQNYTYMIIRITKQNGCVCFSQFFC